MKHTRHIVLQYLLALSMLILPLQNAWSMVSMDSCNMGMSSHTEMKMDMSNCDHHAKQLAVSADDLNSLADQGCSDNHCSSCSHVSFALLSEAAEANPLQQRISPRFKETLLSFLIPLDSPPPIFS